MTLVRNPADSSPEIEEQLVGFPELFEAQVARTPNDPAVFFEDEELDYRQLNQLANQIAWMLIADGISREQRIGICLDRSINAIAAMLGILKAGGSFVPLDPEYPVDRLHFIVEDAEIDFILCEPKYAALFESSGNDDDSLKVVDLDSVDLDQFKCENPGREISASDLAYIMYTSGSTGKPKGVQIEHGSLAAYCYADIDVYQLRPSDRTLQFSTLSFDIAIEEIYPPLIMGGSVVVRPRERAAAQNELSEIVNRYGVTAIHLATAYWHEWVDLMVASNERVPA
ncbi:MAG: AMP-binding protein, partial [Planctomycetota bacterium]